MQTPGSCREHPHTLADFFYWITFLSLPLLTACIGVAAISVAALFGYLLLCAGMLVVIYRFFCTRCPHYAQEGGKTRCMFVWGLPGFFKPASGPYSGLEKALSAGAFITIFAVPLTWLRLDFRFLVLYLLATALFLATMRRTECGRCLHEHCPGNKAAEQDGNGREGHPPSR